MTRLFILLLMLASAAGTGHGAGPLQASAQTPDEPKPTCTDSLQVLVDSVAPGSVLQVRTDCIYREDVVVGVPMILDGQGGAEIRGSDVWTSWIPFDGLWVSVNAVPELDAEAICNPDSDGRCLLPEQVFRGGVAQKQVATGAIPGPGEFALNVRRQVVVAEDPSSATMEVSVRNRWMRIQADNVTVQGFTMKHAATPAQHGALRIDNVSAWVVQSNTLSDAHGANLYFRTTSNGQLLNNELFNGGQLGFGGRGSNIQIRGNRVHHNNTEDFSIDWEAAGAKITESDLLVVDGNHFYENNGPGIWCDIDCSNVTISNNRVNNNYRVGIFFEISDGADIFGNVVWENTAGSDDRGWSGIFISSSRNARVHDNIVAWNGNGIEVISQCRGFLPDEVTCDLEHPWNGVYGNEIHNNVIIMGSHGDETSDIVALGWIRDIEDPEGTPVTFMFTPEANNRGYDNVYWVPEPGDGSTFGFLWGDETFDDLDDFNATPGEENGRLLDEAERDQILSDAGVPLQPEDRSVSTQGD